MCFYVHILDFVCACIYVIQSKNKLVVILKILLKTNIDFGGGDIQTSQSFL